MKKVLNLKVIVLLIIIVIIGIVYLISSLKLSSYLRKKGFVAYDDTMYYKKQTETTKESHEKNVENKTKSNYDYLYFSLGTNHMSEEIGFYDEEVNLEYIGEYSYKSNKVIYSIRGEYNSTVIQFTGEGNFNKKEFSCGPVLYHDIDYDNEISSSVCELAKEYSVKLHKNSVEIIDNSIVLNRIIKQTDE